MTTPTVAMTDENGIPYAIPMNFGYENDTIYLHSTQNRWSFAYWKKSERVHRVVFSTNMKQYSDRTFTYSVPAVNNVKIWKVKIGKMSAKEFGVKKPGTISFD